jgi:hypothetical protein
MSSATAPAAANQQPAIGALDGRSADARAEPAAAMLGFFVITFDAVVPTPDATQPGTGQGGTAKSLRAISITVW